MPTWTPRATSTATPAARAWPAWTARSSASGCCARSAAPVARRCSSGSPRSPCSTTTASERIDAAAALASREAFAALADCAEQWLAAHTDAGDRLVAQRDELLAERYPLLARRTELQGERASLEGRSGRVPEHLHAMRREVARASGMAESELPFVAELLDVAPEESRWRLAIETVLGATARTMLVPLPRLEEFSAAIDSLRLRGRLTFEGAQLDLDAPDLLDPDRVAGKLVFADSPFRGWVQRHVAEPSRNALCVESAEDLRGGGFRVTLAGQTRSGTPRLPRPRRPAQHHRLQQRRRARRDRRRHRRPRGRSCAPSTSASPRVETATRVQERRRTAYDALGTQAYDDLDVAACDERIADLERRREQILTADDRLGTTEQQMTELAERLEEARLERFRLDERRRRLEAEHAELVDSEDLVNDELERIESATVRSCAPRSRRAASTRSSAPRPTPTTPRTSTASTRAPGACRRGSPPRSRRRRSRSSTSTASWPRSSAPTSCTGPTPTSAPPRSPTPTSRASSPTSRPPACRSAARSGAVGSPSGAGRTWCRSRARCRPRSRRSRTASSRSTRSCARLEFGAEKDRLRIRLRRLAPAHVQVFLRELRELSRGTVRDLDEAALEERFTRLRRFMGQLRGPAQGADPERAGERERLLDVRRHVEVSAERYDRLTGELKSTYRTLGEKSGGESQELVAFIVGSALRFRLGDEMRSRPRFAPVFLDEGFVKADSEFAGRAVRAWKGLGFQLVIAVPLDKVTGLEPHMDALLVITKHTDTQLSSVFRVQRRTGERRRTLLRKGDFRRRNAVIRREVRGARRARVPWRSRHSLPCVVDGDDGRSTRVKPEHARPLAAFAAVTVAAGVILAVPRHAGTPPDTVAGPPRSRPPPRRRRGRPGGRGRQHPSQPMPGAGTVPVRVDADGRPVWPSGGLRWPARRHAVAGPGLRRPARDRVDAAAEAAGDSASGADPGRARATTRVTARTPAPAARTPDRRGAPLRERHPRPADAARLPARDAERPDDAQ